MGSVLQDIDDTINNGDDFVFNNEFMPKFIDRLNAGSMDINERVRHFKSYKPEDEQLYTIPHLELTGLFSIKFLQQIYGIVDEEMVKILIKTNNLVDYTGEVLQNLHNIWALEKRTVFKMPYEPPTVKLYRLSNTLIDKILLKRYLNGDMFGYPNINMNTNYIDMFQHCVTPVYKPT